MSPDNGELLLAADGSVPTHQVALPGMLLDSKLF
jgi:hypothetical protein